MAEFEGMWPANEWIEKGAACTTFEIWDLGLLVVTGKGRSANLYNIAVFVQRL